MPDKKNGLIVKSNRLVEASYRLELAEQRLVLMAIENARSSGKGIAADSFLAVHANEYAAIFGLDMKNAYHQLKEAAENLYQRSVRIHNVDELTGKPCIIDTRWVAAVKYVEGAGVVHLQFSGFVVPYITRLEAEFTSYKIKSIAQMTSTYSIRLYELLMQWKKNGVRDIDLQEFKKILQVEGQYTALKDFKNRVLDLAISQINQFSDIQVSYENIKLGRKVTGFSFSFSEKNSAKLPQEKKIKRATSKVAQQKPIADLWDKLHEMELQACRKLNPSLTRSDIESLAQQQSVDALMIMHRIKTSTAKNFELTPVEP